MPTRARADKLAHRSGPDRPVSCTADTGRVALAIAELKDAASTVLDVWKYGGQSVIAALVTAWLVRAQGSRREVSEHNRRVADLNQDLRRWVVDRDRELGNELALIAAYARNPDLEGEIVGRLVALRAPVPDELRQHPAGSQYDSGAHLTWRAKAARQALQEWRDEGTESDGSTATRWRPKVAWRAGSADGVGSRPHDLRYLRLRTKHSIDGARLRPYLWVLAHRPCR